jgi:dTDP-4-dehydrorhamnose reductase
MTDESAVGQRIAVLGADSFIGRSMLSRLQATGCDFVGTTRRNPRGQSRLIRLDLLDQATWGDLLAARPTVAIAFFAVSKLDQCESDPQSRDINALRIPALLDRLATIGCRTVFISTNSVFGGVQRLPDEDDPVNPGIAYATQKREAEVRLQESPGKHSHVVVRITRCISAELPPFAAWLADLQAGKAISAFDDFIFAPMTLPYVTEGLLRVARSEHRGIFHLSGTDVSYFEFARELAAQFSEPPHEVCRTNSITEGVHLRFRPQYSAIGMRRTTDLLGIRPQPFQDVVAHLIASTRAIEGP